MTDVDIREPAGGTSLGDSLGRLLDRDLAPRQRVRAFRDFGIALKGGTGGIPGLMERGAEALAVAVTRLPIRGTEDLRVQYGADDEVVAEQVIDDAARLAAWLWAAAGALPVPPLAVNAIKTVVQSAIEIRMVAELYTVYGTPVSTPSPAWLSVVLDAWAVGQPVTVTPGTVAGVRDLAGRLRRSYDDLATGESRAAVLATGGRAGSDLVRRTGRRYQRRMRVHPRMWAQPGEISGVAVIQEEAGKAVRGRLLSTGHRGAAGSLHDCLATAWTQHTRAYHEAEGVPAGDVRERLARALTLQQAHLRDLSTRLGSAPPVLAPAAVPEPRPDGEDATVRVHEHLALAENAIDDTETIGARPRRLAGWPVRVRNGLVYLLTALSLAVPFAGLILPDAVASPLGVVALLLLMCVVVPGAALALGAVAIGLLFRPRLGGRVSRSPLLGLTVSFTVTVVTAIALGVAAMW
jgi:hypothetical protein